MSKELSPSELGKSLYDLAGVAANVESAYNCMTRLRFLLKDVTAADQEAIKRVPGVFGTNVMEQELQIIGQGFIHYRHAEVYGVDVKQVNQDNWTVYSTIKLESVVGGNEVTTPFFVTQIFTREDGKWWLTAMVFTTRVAGPGIE